jgi:hypothetical protein
VDLESFGDFEASDIFANNVTRKNIDLVMIIHGAGIGYSSYQLYGYRNKQHSSGRDIRENLIKIFITV